nr:hypothetical protein Iba_chr01eCG8130 [Ipomoea batatas]
MNILIARTGRHGRRPRFSSHRSSLSSLPVITAPLAPVSSLLPSSSWLHGDHTVPPVDLFPPVLTPRFFSCQMADLRMLQYSSLCGRIEIKLLAAVAVSVVKPSREVAAIRGLRGRDAWLWCGGLIGAGGGYSGGGYKEVADLRISSMAPSRHRLQVSYPTKSANFLHRLQPPPSIAFRSESADHPSSFIASRSESTTHPSPTAHLSPNQSPSTTIASRSEIHRLSVANLTPP